MTIEFTCNECGATVYTSTKMVGDRVEVIVTPCQHCIARKALMATENAWVKAKLEKEAA